MKLSQFGIATALVISCIAAPWVSTIARAEQAPEVVPEDPLARFVGTYDYSKGAEHGRSIIREAMEKGVQQMSAILRPLGRRKMTSMDPFNQQIIIARPENRISVTLIGRETLTFDSRPGVPEQATFWRGEEVEVTQRLVKNRLVQTINASKKQATFTYTLLPDGHGLLMHTKMAPRMLDTPIVWQLAYTRQ